MLTQCAENCYLDNSIMIRSTVVTWPPFKKRGNQRVFVPLFWTNETGKGKIQEKLTTKHYNCLHERFESKSFQGPEHNISMTFKSNSSSQTTATTTITAYYWSFILIFPFLLQQTFPYTVPWHLSHYMISSSNLLRESINKKNKRELWISSILLLQVSSKRNIVIAHKFLREKQSHTRLFHSIVYVSGFRLVKWSRMSSEHPKWKCDNSQQTTITQQRQEYKKNDKNQWK